MTMRLGPFELVAPAGRGAMAEVWRAVHHRQGVSVAIKVVTAPSGREERFRRLFAREVRAVSRLDHPGVVRVHDHGEVPETGRIAERLPPGAPYLVMDWLGEGSLRSRAPMPWPALRSTLLRLLDALAHAHARGLVHRDLKIDNVLYDRSGPVLTDFGLAWQTEDAALVSDGRRRLMGTPNYMAPEQIDADNRGLGPWTDLYAIGCLAWCLATGRPPYDRPSPIAVLQAHVDEDPPTLRSAHPLPIAFEQWARRLLAKRPSARYRFAADAAVALMAIPERFEGPTTRIAGPVLLSSDPSVSDLTLVAPPTFVSITDAAWIAPSDDDRPPIPQSWRGPEHDAQVPVLLGTGQALFGLRAPAMRGRPAERDLLWDTLRRVIESGRARAVIITGPGGRGKTRLASWLGERAHELGVAANLRATHALPRGPACGLGPMLARHLRCVDLPANERLGRIRQMIDDHATAHELAAYLDPAGRVLLGGRALALRIEGERRSTLCRGLERLSRLRPLVVQLDDVHWAEDGLRFVEHLLEHQAKMPVMLVITARDDELRPTAPARLLIDRLVQRDDVAQLALGPLEPADLGRHIRAMLPLDEGLVGELVQRSGGSPVFAEEMIRHWLAASALESGPNGFKLKATADRGPPGDLQALWASRLADALRDAEPDAIQAFEVAAALGQQVDPDEWNAACAVVGLAPPERGLELMLDARMMRADDDGIAFVHAMLREALQQQAVRLDRAARWNRACAYVLRARGAAPVRLAEHLIAAGEHLAALDPLARAISAAIRRSDFAASLRLSTRRVQVLRTMRVPRGQRAWVLTRIFLSRVLTQRGEYRAGRRWAMRAARSAKAAGSTRLLMHALIALGEASMKSASARVEALHVLDKAHAIAVARGDGERAAQALTVKGTTLLVNGRTEEARAAFETAHRQLMDVAAPDPELLGEVLRKLTDTARRVGDHDTAWAHGQAAYNLYKRIGARWPMARVSNTLGDILRYRGDLAGAVRRYEELRQLSEELGIEMGRRYAETNLGLVLIELERYAEARPLLAGALAYAHDRGDDEVLAYLHAALWPCDAARGNWTAWDLRRRALRPLFEGRYHDPDVAMAATHAERLARAAGRGARAADARRLARIQLEALGRGHEADALTDPEAPRTTAPSAPFGPTTEPSAPGPPGATTAPAPPSTPPTTAPGPLLAVGRTTPPPADFDDGDPTDVGRVPDPARLEEAFDDDATAVGREPVELDAALELDFDDDATAVGRQPAEADFDDGDDPTETSE